MTYRHDVVVRQGSFIVKLFAPRNETLLVGRCAVYVLNLDLQTANVVVRSTEDRKGLSRGINHLDNDVECGRKGTSRPRYVPRLSLWFDYRRLSIVSQIVSHKIVPTWLGLTFGRSNLQLEAAYGFLASQLRLD